MKIFFIWYWRFYFALCNQTLDPGNIDYCKKVKFMSQEIFLVKWKSTSLCFLASVPPIASCLSVLILKHSLTVSPWGNLFKMGQTFTLSQGQNWVHCGHQRSRLTSQNTLFASQQLLGVFFFFLFSISTQEWADKVVEGHSSKLDMTPFVFKNKIRWFFYTNFIALWSFALWHYILHTCSCYSTL